MCELRKEMVMEKLKSEGKYQSAVPDRQGGSDVDGVGGHLPDR